jgi:hypothetical protein
VRFARSIITRYLLSAPAAIFLCVFANSWLGNLEPGAGSRSAGLTIVFSYLFASSLGLWVISDAQERGRSLPYDFGTFVFFAWGLLVPWYLFSTRGWRGLLVIGGFVLLYLAAAFLGNALGAMAESGG